MTLREVVDRTEALAKYLASSFRGRRSTWNSAGDNIDYDVTSVGLLSPNELIVPIVSYGCLAAGVPLALLPVGSSPSEIGYLTRRGQCEIVIVHPSQLDNLIQSGYPLDMIILTQSVDRWTGKTLPTLLEISSQLAPVIVDGQHPLPTHEVALILFSSGSTGNPKAVMITHRNVYMLVICFFVVSSKKSDESQAKTIILSVLPMSHSYGFVTSIIAPILSGSTLCIMRKWQLDAMLSAIPKYKITEMAIVPTMAIQILSEAERLRAVDISSLQTVFLGSSFIDPAHKRNFFDLMLSHGALAGQKDDTYISNGYGLSETTSGITTSSKDATPTGRAPAGTIGFLLPGFQARVISESSTNPAGEDVPKHTAGELCLRGPSIMKGYLSDPQATQAAFTSDGWLKTGDIVRIAPEGSLTHIDRLKDTFKNRGKQVSPSEIASLVIQHFGDVIADIAVVGAPAKKESRHVGEEAWAFVVLKNVALGQRDKEQLAEKIKKLTQEKLSIHKWVVRVEWLDELPKGLTHKVLVRALRDLATKVSPETHRAKL